MAYRLGAFAGVLDEALLRVLLSRQETGGARLRRLWGYYASCFWIRGSRPRYRGF
jgi:hypothetical protein